MQHKLTISIDEEVYKGLHKVIGRGNISRFLEDLARPYLMTEKKTQAPRNRKKKEGADDFIELCHRLAEESRRNGMTQEILQSILAENR